MERLKEAVLCCLPTKEQLDGRKCREQDRYEYEKYRVSEI